MDASPASVLAARPLRVGGERGARDGVRHHDGASAPWRRRRVRHHARGERAAALGLTDVARVLGVAETHSHRHLSAMASLVHTAASVSGGRAFAEAGVGTADIDSAQLYDAFTITPILFLEDLGFCAKGDGGEGDEVVLVHGNGGVLSSRCTAILGRG